MRRGRVTRALVLGAALAGAGAVVAPAMAAHYDPGRDGWVTDCSAVPGFDSSRAVSGFQPWAGTGTGSGTWYGVRSGDPYYVANVNPDANNPSATVAVWQPWYDATPQAAGLVQGPWFIDMSVTVDRNGPHVCNGNSNFPPVHKPVAQ
ncbi:MAG: hypothetical protein QOI20_1953 [Acidimicrobiaceae bacterium]|nr:hypothetical protein [Acidimicrobiaceae bacterium]